MHFQVVYLFRTVNNPDPHLQIPLRDAFGTHVDQALEKLRPVSTRFGAAVGAAAQSVRNVPVSRVTSWPDGRWHFSPIPRWVCRLKGDLPVRSGLKDNRPVYPLGQGRSNTKQMCVCTKILNHVKVVASTMHAGIVGIVSFIGQLRVRQRTPKAVHKIWRKTEVACTTVASATKKN